MTVSVLVTRPRAAAERFAARLRDRIGPDLPIVVSPLMRIDAVPDALPPLAGIGALIVTSRHAVPVAAGAPGAATRPCYCVGAATAQAARAAGLDPIDGGGTAETLARRIVSDAPRGPLLYLHGDHVASDLAAKLSAAGVETREAVVYRQVATPLSAAATELLAGTAPVVVPLFSPRSAELFFAATEPRAPLFAAVISRKTAAAIPPGVRCRVARAPDAEAMLAATASLASDAKRVESGHAPQ
jgi:uroporphyrinogen-III synthase